MATISFWLTYDHVRCAILVHVERVGLLRHVRDARPDLMAHYGRVNVSILPVKQRGHTRAVHQRDLYFNFDEEVCIPNVKTTYIGGSGLRIRFYLCKGKLLKGERLADECKALHDVSLTSERTYHIITLTPEVSDHYEQTRNNVAHKQVHGQFFGEAIRSAGRFLLLQSRPDLTHHVPSLAIQLNYDSDDQTIIVHLQRASLLRSLSKVVTFEILLIMLDGKVEYRTRSSPFVSDESVNIIHEAFRVPADPRDTRFCTILINILANKGLGKGPFREHFQRKGYIAFGANSTGVKERQQYQEAFKDKYPTELVWYYVHQPDDTDLPPLHYIEGCDSPRRRKSSNVVSPLPNVNGEQ